ncbi:MAG: bifunctional diaminohydroxyphosphoribosylaminopyrimidine deaminase/5-amino-6-(5-phosphoribosylamino)uracil reductase RibD [Candidatus Tokpelaia sp.]|nr:MAG: bifunctional diaminohydroxyphosphoribosylaminopyrimidine deaminase/5-amino-6-(5-phosphoribosylamino)uracil reductase RibD [Candidatus Tokpelaia sp.]KAA6207718.1 MAG: bifunctional diaminohydroxyphosphoribosylaminopyrimidine deaminase/5-amino-6-(5-phosphoribosylamino)uracil reductase RibD [Candidatus Tokpelaia sp.]
MANYSKNNGNKAARHCDSAPRFSDRDKYFMAEAVALAHGRLGRTGENPAVGAVLVREEEGQAVIIGSSATAAGGRPHAEISALRQAGAKAHGAALYVTLEPCCHFGQTPPCTEALIKAGVTRVIIAVSDPDRRVNGGGIKVLRQAGIKVETGCLAAQAAEDLAAYLCRRKFARPAVTAKLAVSADGFIGRLGEGKIAISGAKAQQEVHRLRAAHDAVLIGIGTALADNPRLDCRLSAGQKPELPPRLPVRVVLDTDLRLSCNSHLAQTAGSQPVWIFCGRQAPAASKAQLQQAGCRVFTCESRNAALNIEQVLALLAAEGINSVLLEGGAKLMQAFWDKALVDRLIMFQTPLIIGAGGYKKPDFGSKNGYERVETRCFGDDVKETWLHLWGKGGLLAPACE